jgi:type VII secretion-associated serine protease mycosin
MRGGTGRVLIVAVCATLVGLLIPPVAVSATIKGCPEQMTRYRKVTAIPDAQIRYDVDRLTPLTAGSPRTVVVAVIDSGVDGDHPQLRGRLLDGKDFLGNRSDALQDCKGHGTGVAGIIAAGPADGVGFRGLAPDARILPIRVTENTEKDKQSVDPQAEIDKFAAAITYAVEQHVDIINLSLTLKQDDTGVREAVARAVDDGIVVVAAAGNQGGEADGNPTPYPAAYDGVLGVGAIGPTGQRADFSQHGEYVDVTAPGDQIVMTAAGGGHWQQGGTSFATPFVSATAALVMQRFPKLRGQGVIKRIVDTADPAPGGRHSDAYGYGVLNPYRALTETVVPPGPGRAAAAPLPTEDPAVAALQNRREQARASSLRLAAIGAAGTLVVVLVVLVVPNGRRRRWSPAGRS